jgi:hypothetical protein
MEEDKNKISLGLPIFNFTINTKRLFAKMNGECIELCCSWSYPVTQLS